MEEIDRDPIRADLLKYTRQAFEMLPGKERPHILDAGCGSGVPSLYLAQLSGGQIIGVDIDHKSLSKLIAKAHTQGLSDRVNVVRCSLQELAFSDESFDLIWAEGSIAVIGFGQGLQKWRRFLRPKGFLAVHDETGDIQKKLDLIPTCGYDLIGHFTLPHEVWWNEHYRPLQTLINRLRAAHAEDPDALSAIEKEQQEIDLFRSDPERFSSAFFIMQKR